MDITSAIHSKYERLISFPTKLRYFWYETLASIEKDFDLRLIFNRSLLKLLETPLSFAFFVFIENIILPLFLVDSVLTRVLCYHAGVELGLKPWKPAGLVTLKSWWPLSSFTGPYWCYVTLYGTWMDFYAFKVKKRENNFTNNVWPGKKADT